MGCFVWKGKPRTFIQGRIKHITTLIHKLSFLNSQKFWQSLSSATAPHFRPFVRPLGSQSQSLTDTFTEIIQSIKSKQSALTPALRTYQPRYHYRGDISGPKYITTKYKSTDIKIPDEPHKHFCMLIAYSGANCVGYQRQSWALCTNTIEEVLLKAMLTNNWISESHYWKPFKVRMQQASRTDRGVSASRQFVSLFMCK